MAREADEPGRPPFGVHVPEPRRLGYAGDAGQANYVCAECGSERVQYAVPAWYDFNTGELISTDDGCDPLMIFCEECEESASVINRDTGRHISGHWDS